MKRDDTGGAAGAMRIAATMTIRRAAAIWAALALAALVVFALSLTTGSVSVTFAQAFDALTGAGAHAPASTTISATSATPDVVTGVVRMLRLPRALGGFACGALLALAGALLQVLLRNPLAEPYVLGVSGGAATAAFVALLAGAAWWAVQASACAGAFASILLVLGFARHELWLARARGGMRDRVGNGVRNEVRNEMGNGVGNEMRHEVRNEMRDRVHDDAPRLLLTGAVLAAGWGAALTLLLTLAPDAQLRGMLFWLTGDLSGTTMPWPALATLGVALACVVPGAPRLNVLLRGDASAQALGVNVARLRLSVYLVASLAAAAAVTTGGTIGFVGLIVPHMLRLAFGNDQRMLLVAAALAGGVAVMGADLVARTVAAPTQLPVGVVTALAGVPVFLWMLLRRR